MARTDTLGHFLTDIANAIRTKKGTSATITASSFDTEIASIPTGITPTGTKNITSNGTYDVTEYASANVNVSEEPIPASVSGYTEFDIGVTKMTGLTIPCYMDGEKDWGDGTTDSLTEHTYEDYGNYTIVCKGNTIPTGSAAAGGGVFGSLTTNNNCAICLAIRVGNNVSVVGQYAFYACTACDYIHLPDSVTTLGSNGTFRYCHTLRRVRLPASMNTFPGSGFTTCSMLYDVNIEGIKVIPASMFSACASLEKVKINPAVDTISASAFGNCTGLKEIDFTELTAVPTLSNVNALGGINKTCKFIVPDNLYDSWIIATNWSTFADYIYKESEI